MNLKTYFSSPKSSQQRLYEALRLHSQGTPIAEAAAKMNLSVSYVTAIKSQVIDSLKMNIDPFFPEAKRGPKTRHKVDLCKDKIIALRKQNYSILDIKASLEACGFKISHNTINSVLKEEGFARLSRRTYSEKSHLTVPKKIVPERTSELILKNEDISTGRSGGILAFLPIIEKLGIITAIQNAGYPSTKDISNVSYVLAFLALKLIGNKRLSHDESWSFDRILGLFAGLNILPKNSSLSSYSYRISREQNYKFLIELNRIFASNSESSTDYGEFNLDFKTIPHWGDESVLEKNYSTTRGKAVKSVLALIVQNIADKNIAYTNAEITHHIEKDSILEFVDFWKDSKGTCPKMLIFDSQFTIYENLRKLEDDGIKFLTLRRRSKEMIEYAKSLSSEAWATISVEAGKRKSRRVQVYEETIKLKKYKKEIRQIIIVDHSKEPIFMLTNDFDAPVASLIRKYGRRWLVEQEIAEQIAFFHLNQLSSSIVVKVDFDLTLTVLAHNLYRYLGSQIARHENDTVQSLHRRFIEGKAKVIIEGKKASVILGKRSHSPLLFEMPEMQQKTKLSWHGFEIGYAIDASS